MSQLKTLNINAIRVDGGTQSRVSIDQDVVAEYSAAITDGAVMPPVTVLHDGADYWLVDGFHRLHAALASVKTSIQAHVQTGTQRAAIFASLAVNKGHGLRPTNDDKRKAVNAILADAEWAKMSDREIAKHCAVSHTFVAIVRNPKVETPVAPKPKTTGAGGAGTLGDGPVGGEKTHKGGNVATPPAQTEAEQQAAQIAADAHGGDDLATLVDEQTLQITELQAQVAAAMADDLKAEAMRFQRIAQIATRRQNELMETISQRESEIKRHVNSLRRIGKAVGEDDPAKVAATVEEFVRTLKVSA